MGQWQSAWTVEEGTDAPAVPNALEENERIRPAANAKLTRSLTFYEGQRRIDDRKGAARMGLRKSSTFAEHLGIFDLRYEDVLYRRFFNVPAGPGRRASRSSVEPSLEPVGAETPTHAVVVVDSSDGAGTVLARQLSLRSYHVIQILTDQEQTGTVEGMTCLVAPSMTNPQSSISDAVLLADRAISVCERAGLTIVAIVPSSGPCAELAHNLRLALGPNRDPPAIHGEGFSTYSQDKLVTALVASNVSIAGQEICRSWPELSAAMTRATTQPASFELLVSPLMSQGCCTMDCTSYICCSKEQLQKAYGNLVGRVFVGSEDCKGVTVRRYTQVLQERHYIVDTVSRAGAHRICAVWALSYTTTGNSQRLLDALTLIDSQSDAAFNHVSQFVESVLGAAGLQDGATHTTVAFVDGRCSLLGLSPACHGGGGAWVELCDRCIGYTQVSMLAAALAESEDFLSYPVRPTVIQPGIVKCLWNTAEHVAVGGKVLSWSKSFTEAAKTLHSFVCLQERVSPGETLMSGEDGFVRVGAVALAHTDVETLSADEHAITYLATGGDPVLELEILDARGPCVCVVDPFSTGAVVAADICARGLGCVCLYSSSLETLGNLTSFVPAGLTVKFDAVSGYSGGGEEALRTVCEWLRGLQRPVLAVIAGAETGVELADSISEMMGLRTNGTTLSTARRNKYLMGERVREYGVRAVRQQRAGSCEEATRFVSEAFSADLQAQNLYCVVKPTESAGSDDVMLCRSMGEVQRAVEHIMGKKNCLGQPNTAVLVQEYLEGTEYVVDCVSRDGEHKVCAVWEYDRKPVNGRMFICHGQRLLTLDDPHVLELIDYQKNVLNALGILHGPSHGEVKMSRSSPCLVEVGARCHGAEGAWAIVADAVYGYNQVKATVDVYVDGQRFADLPAEPRTRRSHGSLLFIISHVEGIVREVNQQYLEEIEHMASFVHLEIFPKVGGRIVKTIDCLTFGGIVKLVHEDKATLDANYNRIREMETTGLFVAA